MTLLMKIMQYRMTMDENDTKSYHLTDENDVILYDRADENDVISYKPIDD